MSHRDDELAAIQAIFFEECAEGLQAAEASLSTMVAGETSIDVIAGLFRAVHSIKGGSSAFGFGALMAFSHRFENVLDAIRAGQIAPHRDVIQAMLTAFDILADHVAAARAGSPPPIDEAASQMLEALLATPRPALSQSIAVETEAIDFVPVPVDVAALDGEPVFLPIAADLEGALGGVEPSPWLVRFSPSATALAYGGEPLLLIRELEEKGGAIVEVDTSRLPGLRELDPESGYFDWTIRLPGTVAKADILDCFDFVVAHSTVDIQRDPRAGIRCTSDNAMAPATVPAAAAQTVRVELTKLDELLALVSALALHGARLSDRLQPADRDRIGLPALSRLTRRIQDGAMALRAQPIRHIFSRIPRMLRDLMRATGKQVVLEIGGEMTEVDQCILERIGNPLTHMIRNAVDHGIELPEERTAAGKPPAGRLHVTAEQSGARILVRVRDDGKGIDRPRVRAKAIERGIIAADAILSDDAIDRLICTPGFSTASAISAISGRGVGMDVVHNNVAALGGHIEIHSVPGLGTEICMVLPLAPLDGMIADPNGRSSVGSKRAVRGPGGVQGERRIGRTHRQARQACGLAA